jgi:predicted RNA-binding protein with PUA-like domain
MNYWVIKSEPTTYSWERLQREGKTTWDGVRNFAARIHLNTMVIGDWCLFYHSNDGKEIVGIAEVIKTAFPDPTADDPRWVAVDIKPAKKLKKPVSLETIKADAELSNIALVKIGRLSVSPLTKKEFDRIIWHSEK